MNITKQSVDASVCEQSSDDVSKFTGEDVKLTAGTMKKCKGDVTGSYTSDQSNKNPLQRGSVAARKFWQFG